MDEVRGGGVIYVHDEEGEGHREGRVHKETSKENNT